MIFKRSDNDDDDDQGPRTKVQGPMSKDGLTLGAEFMIDQMPRIRQP